MGSGVGGDVVATLVYAAVLFFLLVLIPLYFYRKKRAE